MQKIRVLVANRPRLMRELVLATISGQPDMEVVGEVQDNRNLTEVVAELRPDYLIIGLDQSDERPGICDWLLERYPQMKILALASERNSTIFYWATLSICANRVETSEDGILNALRGRMQASADAFVHGSEKVQ